MVVAVLTFGGSRFHVVAAATANARSEVLFDRFHVCQTMLNNCLRLHLSSLVNEHLTTVADELESKCSAVGRGR